MKIRRDSDGLVESELVELAWGAMNDERMKERRRRRRRRRYRRR